MKRNPITAGNTGTARLASMLGLCRRAGRLGCGVDAVTDALKTGRAPLVLLASDASERTRKQITDKCAAARARLIPVSMTKAELGTACGLDELSVCSVSDPNFLSAIAAIAGQP